MIQHMTAAAVALLCLASALVSIESLSTRRLVSRRPSNNIFQSRKKNLESLQCPAQLLPIDRTSSSCLFSSSDYSSHPYSVYYGTSGSTAKQNFNQNDDINDVYGYGPDDNGREGHEEHHESIQLHSMQDDARLTGGRRGATVFCTKYDGVSRVPTYSSNDFYNEPRVAEDRHRFLQDDRYMEDPRVMDQLDGLLCERDSLRRNLDAVVRENIYLQNHHNTNGIPQSMHLGQDQHHHNTNGIPQPNTNTNSIPQPMHLGQVQHHHNNNAVPQPNTNGIPQSMHVGQDQHRHNTNVVPQSTHVGQDQSTRSVVDSVMTELKNMQQTLHAVQAEQQQANTKESRNLNPAPASAGSEAPTVESVIAELRNMQQSLQTLGAEQQQPSTHATNAGNVNNASTGEASQPVNAGGDTSKSSVHQRHNFEVNLKGPAADGAGSRIGSITPDHAAGILSGEYVVVVNAELKRKIDIVEKVDQDDRRIGGNGPEMDIPPFSGETFGSKYL